MALSGPRALLQVRGRDLVADTYPLENCDVAVGIGTKLAAVTRLDRDSPREQNSVTGRGGLNRSLRQ